MTRGPELRATGTTKAASSTPATSNSFNSPPPRRKQRKKEGLNRTITICLSAFLCTFIFLYLVGFLLFLPWSSTVSTESEPGSSRRSSIMKIDRTRVKHLVENAFKRKPSKAEQIFEDALKEFQINRDTGSKPRHKVPVKEKTQLRKRDAERKKITFKEEKKVAVAPHGVIVLGMHRSGTSMLAGLLVKGLGYDTGGPLIGQSFDNKKGFFERIDVVLQNDQFLGKQQANWDSNVMKYDPAKGHQHKIDGVVKWKEGEKALKFLNDPSKSPWLQKDPRMCITLKTWLPLLNAPPAIIFTYRHPLQVALSLKKRNKLEGFPNFALEKGFRIWIIYNMRAIQSSADLCTVYTSNTAVLSNAQNEVQRISDELASKCRLKPPPKQKLTTDTVHTFVDPTLQHSKEHGDKLLTTFNEDCQVYDYEREYHDKTSEEYIREYDLYLIAMRIYCDFESGKAYKTDYGWPELP